MKKCHFNFHFNENVSNRKASQTGKLKLCYSSPGFGEDVIAMAMVINLMAIPITAGPLIRAWTYSVEVEVRTTDLLTHTHTHTLSVHPSICSAQ